MPFARDRLVAVTDTNALARRACGAVRAATTDDLFPGLAITGRSNTFVAGHVPEELADHLRDVADSTRVAYSAAEEILWRRIMPAIPVVDLAVRDHLHPRIRSILRDDREIPKALRGDPDDVGTVALAEFLAPALILSADSVFYRLGLTAHDAARWVETARSLLAAAGFEATLDSAAGAVELAANVLCAAGAAIVGLVRRHPMPALCFAAVGLYVAYRLGWLRGEVARNRLRALWDFVGPMLSGLGDIADAQATARRSLIAIEPYEPATLEEVAARFLARHRGGHLPADLRDQLRARGHQTSAAALKRIMDNHPAFLRRPGGLYIVGTMAKAARPYAVSATPWIGTLPFAFPRS